MGNGTPCKILGGTIIIKMFDGVLRTMIGDQHVPNLKRNLILLGELDFDGCSGCLGRKKG